VLIVVGLVVALVVGGLALNGRAASSSDGENSPRTIGADLPTTLSPTPTPSSSVDATASLLPVAGLTGHTETITVRLQWQAVDGAESYLVTRDPGRAGEKTEPVTGTRYADRPGDGRRHSYTVVAVDPDGTPGAAGPTVHPSAAATPYGAEQDIASAWPQMIPTKPGAKGGAGQTCKGSKTSSEHSNGRIVCRTSSGVQFQVLRFSSQKERDAREDQLVKAQGAHGGHWAQKGDDATSGGDLVTAGAGVVHGPWRFWTFDDSPRYAMSAQWPKHSAQALASWWQGRSPFHS